jgi:hypothetical protein
MRQRHFFGSARFSFSSEPRPPQQLCEAVRPTTSQIEIGWPQPHFFQKLGLKSKISTSAVFFESREMREMLEGRNSRIELEHKA